MCRMFIRPYAKGYHRPTVSHITVWMFLLLPLLAINNRDICDVCAHAQQKKKSRKIDKIRLSPFRLAGLHLSATSERKGAAAQFSHHITMLRLVKHWHANSDLQFIIQRTMVCVLWSECVMAGDTGQSINLSKTVFCTITNKSQWFDGLNVFAFFFFD